MDAAPSSMQSAVGTQCIAVLKDTHVMSLLVFAWNHSIFRLIKKFTFFTKNNYFWLVYLYKVHLDYNVPVYSAIQDVNTWELHVPALNTAVCRTVVILNSVIGVGSQVFGFESIMNMIIHVWQTLESLHLSHCWGWQLFCILQFAEQLSSSIVW